MRQEDPRFAMSNAIAPAPAAPSDALAPVVYGPTNNDDIAMAMTILFRDGLMGENLLAHKQWKIVPNCSFLSS